MWPAQGTQGKHRAGPGQSPQELPGNRSGKNVLEGKKRRANYERSHDLYDVESLGIHTSERTNVTQQDTCQGPPFLYILFPNWLLSVTIEWSGYSFSINNMPLITFVINILYFHFFTYMILNTMMPAFRIRAQWMTLHKVFPHKFPRAQVSLTGITGAVPSHQHPSMCRTAPVQCQRKMEGTQNQERKMHFIPLCFLWKLKPSCAQISVSAQQHQTCPPSVAEGYGNVITKAFRVALFISPSGSLFATGSSSSVCSGGVGALGRGRPAFPCSHF